MSSTDKFEKFRVMAAYWRSLIFDSNTPEVNAALKDAADFMDKLIAQKEAEQEKSRQSDIASLTAAIIGLTEVIISQQTDMTSLTSAITGLTEVITVQNERVGNAPKAKSPAVKKSKPEISKHKYGEYGHVFLSDEEYSKLIDFFGEKYGSSNAETVLKKYIADVDNYVESHGKPYKGYCQTIKNYHSRDVKSGKSPLSGSVSESHSYNLDKLMDYYMNNPPKINKNDGDTNEKTETGNIPADGACNVPDRG